MKNSLYIWWLFARRMKWHVMVIALNVYLSACSAAIAEPSAVKAPTLPPRNERAEVFNGCLQGCEFGAEKGVDVLRPSSGAGVYGAKLGKDGGAKGRASGSATSFVAVTPADVANERGEKNDAKDGVWIREEGFDHWFWVCVVIALSPLFMANAQADVMKHNVEVTGAASPRPVDCRVGGNQP